MAKGKGKNLVRVSVKKKGKRLKLMVDKMQVFANTGEKIIWKWKAKTKPSAAFSLIFAGETPFQDHDQFSEAGTIVREVVYSPKKHGGRMKIFKYTIAAAYKEKVYLLDPDIIVPKPKG